MTSQPDGDLPPFTLCADVDGTRYVRIRERQLGHGHAPRRGVAA